MPQRPHRKKTSVGQEAEEKVWCGQAPLLWFLQEGTEQAG